MTTRTHNVQANISATIKPGVNDYELALINDYFTTGVVSGMVFTPTGLNVAMTAGVCLNQITNTNLPHGKTYKVFVSSEAENFTIPSGTRTDIIVCQTTPANPDATASNLSNIVHLQNTTVVPANACLLATLVVSGSTVTVTRNISSLINAYLSILDASNRLTIANLPLAIPVENLGGNSSSGDLNLFLNQRGLWQGIVPNAVTKLLNMRVAATVGGTTTKTNLASVTVPANSLDVDNIIRGRFWVSTVNFTAGTTLTLRVELGSQTLLTFTLNAGGAVNLGMGCLDFEIRSDNSASLQDAQGQIFLTQNVMFNQSTSVTKQFATGTGTVNTTSSQTLAVTAQFLNNSGSITFDGGTLELIK